MKNKRFLLAGIDKLSEIGDSICVTVADMQRDSFRSALYIYGKGTGKRFSCRIQTPPHGHPTVFKVTYVGSHQKVAVAGAEFTGLSTDDLATIWCEWNAKLRIISETGVAFIQRVVGMKRLLMAWRQWHDERFGNIV